MASYEELQALAAARTKASQEKLAAERAKREALEREKKLTQESKARQDAQRERESLVAREQKRKRDEEQRKQMEMEKKKLQEKREREQKEREKYGMDVVKFRNATQKAISNAGGSFKLKKKTTAKEREGQDSISPPPNMREYSTLTREEKRQKKEAAMLGLASSGKRKAPSSSHQSHQFKKVLPAGNELVPLGMHKRDTRSVDQIERDLAASRKAKLSLQGRDSQRSRLIEEEKRERELESMLRRTKAMQEKHQMDEMTHRDKSKMRSDSDSSDEEMARKDSREQSPAVQMSRPKANSHEPIRGHTNNSFGLSPADYLPGAPIKASMIAKSTPKPQQAAQHFKSKKETVVEKAGPPKKETPRDRFLREEAEKKKQLEKQKGIKRVPESEDDSDDEEDSESEEESSVEEEEEDDMPQSKRSKVSIEIWKMFNRRDKSEYLARDVDSDDDMEVDMATLRREEERSARLARLEDKREEEALRRKEEEKAQRKAAKGRR